MAFYESLLDLLALIWKHYEDTLQSHPLPTQVTTSCLLWFLGDVLSQRLEGMCWKPRRTLLTALYGAAFIGPFGHLWYNFLDWLVAQWWLPDTSLFLTTKVILDIVVFGILHVIVFFAYMTLAEGGSCKDVRHKIGVDFLPTYAAACMFWPPFQALNFWLVPVHHQLLVVNCGCLLDCCFMCWARSNHSWLDKLLGRWKHVAVAPVAPSAQKPGGQKLRNPEAAVFQALLEP